jgi:pyruvate,orthophosphate dikinase
MSTKYVYSFGDGKAEGTKDMRDLLGGKGANLHEMTGLGIPVPAGFTISTEACREYYKKQKELPEGLWGQVEEGIRKIELTAGKGFNRPENPLLVSVRSGAKFSMPGMMDTVLNLGLNDGTLEGLQSLTGNRRFALDAYRRLIQMFGKVVMDIPSEKFEDVLDEYKEKTDGKRDIDLTPEMLEEIVAKFKAIYKDATGTSFPEDPMEQLKLSVRAVFQSWMGKRAVDYRNFEGISHDLGTAVNVQTMVFGNAGDDSGTGVAFTRNPATGEKKLYGEYLINAQGEDVVAGIRNPKDIAELEKEKPKIYSEFARYAETLERHYTDVQDMEFTFEQGVLYMLQTRTGKRTAQAAVKIAVDMVEEGLIDKDEALMRVEPNQINQLLLPRFDYEDREKALKEDRFLAKGLNASPGAGVGKTYFDADKAEEMAGTRENVILVRPETTPDDVHGMLKAKGVLTARGGATSHAAVVARGLGLPCVAGCDALKIDMKSRVFHVEDKEVVEGDPVSVDGSTGEVFMGEIRTVHPDFEKEHDLQKILGWADEARRLGVWTNADNPRDADRARTFGAEGIGLCRTEHMFFETDRLPIVRKMILAAPEMRRSEKELNRLENQLKAAAEEIRSGIEARVSEVEERFTRLRGEYEGALAELLPIQREDFAGLFKAMDGLPVVIRLIDPPMHEFLPEHEELLLEVEHLKISGKDPDRLKELEALLKVVDGMRERNPMLGLRGVRLGILYPEINEMQVRAIMEAACQVSKEGVDVRPEVMIPLSAHANELKIMRELLERVAKGVLEEKKCDVSYKFGTMIELPRAALTADDVARYAEFFSYGTNDLTQTTFGISRDDAEEKFLLHYVETGVLPKNPFQVLDPDGVGKLVRMGVELGRKTRPDLKVGICGEHGGEPSSVKFCHSAGLNYVSCSPFRVPVARLAAGQASVEEKRGR